MDARPIEGSVGQLNIQDCEPRSHAP